MKLRKRQRRKNIHLGLNDLAQVPLDLSMREIIEQLTSHGETTPQAIQSFGTPLVPNTRGWEDASWSHRRKRST